MAENGLELPEDFRELLPRVARLNAPLYYLYVFDPQTGTVTIENTEGKPRAEHKYHAELAEEIPHPGRIHGYVYPIQGGYRITDWEHRPLTDPFVKRRVIQTLEGQHFSNEPSLHTLRNVS
jgi:hypothetical protein